MKKYVFFTCSVFGIGGGQLYVSNKTEYLKKQGYDVYTISTSIFSKKGAIVYNGLNSAKNLVHLGMENVPGAFISCKRNRIIKNVIKDLDISENDEVILESNALSLALWAELIAAELNCKHIFFSLSEHNQIDENSCDFLHFKFSRGEFASITTKSYNQLLSMSETITEKNLPILRAYLGDYISDDNNCIIEKIDKSDFNICLIGRGEKRYILYSCIELSNFAKKHSDKTVTIALVSQFKNKTDECNISALFDGLENVKFYILGYLTPIPKALFSFFDLYIGGAGCASLAYRQNVLTLAMDLYNDRPLGFLGYDVFGTGGASAENNNTQEYLQDAFFDKKYLRNNFVRPKISSAESVFVLHDEFLASSSKDRAYYVNIKAGIKEKIKANIPIAVKFYRYLKKRIRE